ncbi:MAG: metalloregulator ArsR/SmtB family transcription factor [Acidobacteriota bacterium]|nr:metalloregulator ArsR/SmtB family transcription factor [Acidobacteriota bacterium]
MSIKKIIRIFKALADPTRLRIMFLLRERELCVCELMFILEMEQSRVSHHMRVLREAGIAEDVREGRWIIYGIPDGVRPILRDLFAGSLRERIEGTPEAAGDALKLKICVREKIRDRGPSAGRRQRPPTKRAAAPGSRRKA